MASLEADHDWTQPLLGRSPSPVRYSDDEDSGWNADEESEITVDNPTSRDVDHDVIPETATVGRHIGWFSSYMIIVSRILGSGIFATPGLIFQSAGSVGLSLLLWVIGALISWLALTIGLEYGCALPRSGGKWRENLHEYADMKRIQGLP
jgi:amino acid permease